MANEEVIDALVDKELTSVTDTKLLARIAELRVKPYCVERAWDYGDDGTSYPCWTILEHPETNTGVAYCSEGFGPSFPWGLVFLSGPYTSIGMDSGWYGSLEAAVRESMAWEGPNPESYESY